MATQPQPTPKPNPEPPAPKPPEHPQAPAHPQASEGKADPGEDPNRVITVGEEQLKRSQEMEREGVEAWKARHDDRETKEAKVHPGVRVEHDEPGNTRRR